MLIADITGFGIGVFIHVLAVVVAFGSTFAYPVFMSVAERSAPESVPPMIRSILKADRLLVTPGALIVLASGIYLVADSAGIGFADSWVSVGFLAIIVLLGMAHGFFQPRSRRALALAERDLARDGSLSEEYQAVSRQVAMGGQLASLIVAVTIFFMVVKP